MGLGPAAIAYRVRTRRLCRVHPGVYAIGRPPVTPLERAAAAVLACGPKAVLSHGSAMTLWGFWKRWQSPFDVTVPGDRRPAGIHTHRTSTLTPADVKRQLGIIVTSPGRTLMDCAPRITDAALARAVNDALLSGYLQASHLAALLERCPHHPAAKRLARLVERPGAPTRSELEDAFLVFCKRFGLPSPLVNTYVAGYEVDAVFPAEKLIVELDGYEFHSSRTAFERDRDRDADTLAAGHATVRITWERMMKTPRQEAVRLHAIQRPRRARAA